LHSADSAAQLAAISSRLSAVAAQLASRAAEAAMAPVHQLHALLHEDILRFMARCQHEMEIHASVHEAAISKVKSIVTLLWPRAQAAPYTHGRGSICIYACTCTQVAPCTPDATLA
jgi:hypothetical protein